MLRVLVQRAKDAWEYYVSAKKDGLKEARANDEASAGQRRGSAAMKSRNV